MKKKVLMGVALLGISSLPCFAIWGIEDTVEPGPGWWAQLAAEYNQFVQVVEQGKKAVEQGRQVYNQAQQMAGFVKSAGNWRVLLNNASTQLGMPSLGNDITALSQLKRSNKSAKDILNRILSDSSWQPTAENSVLIQMLHLETVKGVMQENELQDQLNRDLQRISALKSAPTLTMDGMFTAEYRQ